MKKSSEVGLISAAPSDSYLIHFPEVPNWFEGTAKEVKLNTWRTLERLYDDGKKLQLKGQILLQTHRW